MSTPDATTRIPTSSAEDRAPTSTGRAAAFDRPRSSIYTSIGSLSSTSANPTRSRSSIIASRGNGSMPSPTMPSTWAGPGIASWSSMTIRA